MKVLASIKSFLQDEEGASAIEYGLIAALISIVIITAAEGVGEQLSDVFGGIATQLQNSLSGGTGGGTGGGTNP